MNAIAKFNERLGAKINDDGQHHVVRVLVRSDRTGIPSWRD
jgi:hypothetical protein